MHNVTLVYTEYNHRLEVWVLGKRAANITADRQQYINTSKVCDGVMSMVELLRADGTFYFSVILYVTDVKILLCVSNVRAKTALKFSWSFPPY